jgi:hypothetical protein
MYTTQMNTHRFEIIEEITPVSQLFQGARRRCTVDGLIKWERIVWEDFFTRVFVCVCVSSSIIDY